MSFYTPEEEARWELDVSTLLHVREKNPRLVLTPGETREKICAGTPFTIRCLPETWRFTCKLSGPANCRIISVVSGRRLTVEDEADENLLNLMPWHLRWIFSGVDRRLINQTELVENIRALVGLG